MNVHLIDGTYELFRHHFGAPKAMDSAGRPVGAVRSVVGSVLTLLERAATHLAVATDHVIESFRNELWPGYKTGDGMIPPCSPSSTRWKKGSGHWARPCGP